MMKQGDELHQLLAFRDHMFPILDIINVFTLLVITLYKFIQMFIFLYVKHSYKRVRLLATFDMCFIVLSYSTKIEHINMNI